MNGRLFGACFSTLGHKEGAIAPVDYLSTFATAPFEYFVYISISDFVRNLIFRQIELSSISKHEKEPILS